MGPGTGCGPAGSSRPGWWLAGGTGVVVNVLVAGAPLVVWVVCWPGRRGTIAAHVLLRVEEVSDARRAAAAAPVLLHDAVDAGGVPGGRGGWCPPPPEAHARNRASSGDGREERAGAISDPAST